MAVKAGESGGLGIDEIEFDELIIEEEPGDDTIIKTDGEAEKIDKVDGEDPDKPDSENSEEKDGVKDEEGQEGKEEKGKEKEKEEKGDDKGGDEEKGDGEGEEGGDGEQGVIDELIGILGYTDELGEQQFDESVEGIASLVKQSATLMADQMVNSFFDEHPQVRTLVDFVLNGGSEEDYFKVMTPEISYSDLEIGDDDIVLQERVVRDALSAQGLNAEDIQASITEFKDAGILKSQSDRALKALSARQKQEQQQLLKKQEEAAELRQKEEQQLWKDIETLVEGATDLSGLPIPVKEKTDFIDYLRKPIEDGMSQRNLDIQKMTLEQRMAFDYFMFKGFDISAILDRKARTKRATNLRDRLKNRDGENPKGQGKDGKKTKQTSTVEAPDLENLELFT